MPDSMVCLHLPSPQTQHRGLQPSAAFCVSWTNLGSVDFLLLGNNKWLLSFSGWGQLRLKLYEAKAEVSFLVWLLRICFSDVCRVLCCPAPGSPFFLGQSDSCMSWKLFPPRRPAWSCSKIIWGVLHSDPTQQRSQLMICVSVNNWASNFYLQ